MNGARLVNVTSTRYLGVYIDQYLNWNEHIQHILSSARAKIAKIGRLQPLPKKVTSLLYKVFILPIYDYCDVVWMPNSNRYNLLLERQHKRVLKLVFKTNSDHPVLLSDRRRYHTAIQAYKVLHSMTPPCLSSAIRYTKDVTSRIGNNEYRVFVPSVRTNYGRNSFYFKTTSIWNSLQPALYTCNSLKLFKSMYRSLYKI